MSRTILTQKLVLWPFIQDNPDDPVPERSIHSLSIYYST